MKKLQWKSYIFPYNEFESPWMDEQEFERMKASLEEDPGVYDILVVER